MKKGNILLSILFAAFFAILPAGLAGCRSVTPIAHVFYKTENEQYVQFTSHMNAGYAHIFVYDNETQVPNSENYEDRQPIDYYNDCKSACAMYISFKRNMGSEKIKDAMVLDVDIDRWYYMEVAIKKSSGSYGENKKIYLNGKALEIDKSKHDYISDNEDTITYHFEDFGLKRSNPNGQENNVINIIEYK